MGRFKNRGRSAGQGNGENDSGGHFLGAFQPDLAMSFMLLGAFFKFLELVVIRDGINRYVCAAIGGFMIAIGSGLVTWNSLSAIWQASHEVSALKESITNPEGANSKDGAGS